MKKMILAMAALAMTFGFAAKADDNKAQCNCTQPCNEQPCDPACGAPCNQANAPKGRQGYNPFEGLNLTDAQKEQFKQLREKQREEAKAAKADKKQAKKDAKDAKKADRKAEKRARLEEIKKILTPEQYVTFLENQYLNGNQQFNGPRNQGQGRQQFQGRPQGGQRPEKARPEKAQR